MKMPFFLASLLISSTSFAQQIYVQKIKGNKAIIEVSGGTLSAGKSYNLGGGSSTTSNSAGGGGTRDHVVGGSFTFRSGTDATSAAGASTSTKSSDMNLQTRFGWNSGDMEYGPILNYRSVDSDFQGYHYSSLGAGGFFDYNFTPNLSGVSTIFAVTAEGTYGNYAPKTGSGGNSMTAFLGGSLKWFGFTGSTALRADLGYDYQKITVGSASITSSGFAVRAGIATYF